MVRTARPDRLARRRARLAWLLILPLLCLLAIVTLWPLARTVWFSVTDATLFDLSAAAYVGLDNYGVLLADPEWWRSVWNTLFFTAVSVTLEVCLGFAIALTLAARFPARGALRAAVLIPWAIPTVVSAKMWAWMFHDVYGVLNEILLGIGVIQAPVAWTASPDLAMAALIAVDVWKTTPFVALLLLAGLQMLPEDCYEAARVDGASVWTVFFRITVPLMKPALAVAVIFRVLDAMRIFDLVYVLTGTTPQTMTMAVYARQQLIDFQDFGLGSAASTLLFLVIAMVTVIYMMAMGFRPSGRSALAG
jgi:trehalose/maltose transport system permease protein